MTISIRNNIIEQEVVAALQLQLLILRKICLIQPQLQLQKHRKP
jgi:hypothetical protein